MSLALLFNKKKRKETYIGSLLLDATLSEVHDWNAKVTAFPIEDGAEISDFIANEPRTVELSGIVTDSPVVFFSFTTGTTDHVQQALSALQEIRDNRQPISIVTGLLSYENMVMQSLSIPRSPRTGQALEFTARFREIERVQLSYTTIPPKRAKLAKAQAKAHVGKKPTIEAPKAVEDKASALVRITRYVEALAQ